VAVGFNMGLLTKKKISEIDTLLLNLKAGLNPQDLTASEIKLLFKRYGPYWMVELGYARSNYFQIILNEGGNI